MLGSSGIDSAARATLIWGELVPLIYRLTQTHAAMLVRAAARGGSLRCVVIIPQVTI